MDLNPRSPRCAVLSGALALVLASGGCRAPGRTSSAGTVVPGDAGQDTSSAEAADTTATPAMPVDDPTTAGPHDEASPLPDAEVTSNSAAPGEPPPLPPPQHKKVDDRCGRDPGWGEELKAFRLPALDGRTIGNRSYRGRVLLVNFWGTWCKPCLEELPEFDRLYRRYRQHGLTLIAIATDTEPELVREFVGSRKLGAKVLIQGEEYALQYNQTKFPFTFVVDPSGKIVGSYSGFREECMGKLEADVRAQLELRNEGQ